ncbi:MAG: DUF6647 family protein [Pseudomonadota bacterium]
MADRRLRFSQQRMINPSNNKIWRQSTLFGCLVIIALVAAGTLPFPARAKDCSQPTHETIIELYEWIEAKTDYDLSKPKAEPPEILFCAVGEDIPYEDRRMVVEPNDLGVYDPINRRIYLVGSWSETRLEDVAVLLHELVHDVQFVNRTWECPNQSEWEAYKLHELWLSEKGIDAGFDWTRIYFRSKCPRDIHP